MPYIHSTIKKHPGYYSRCPLGDNTNSSKVDVRKRGTTETMLLMFVSSFHAAHPPFAACCDNLNVMWLLLLWQSVWHSPTQTECMRVCGRPYTDEVCLGRGGGWRAIVISAGVCCRRGNKQETSLPQYTIFCRDQVFPSSPIHHRSCFCFLFFFSRKWHKQ